MRVIIFDFKGTLYDPLSNRLHKDVKSALEKLKNKGFYLVVIGKGDRKTRIKILKELEIFHLFFKIHFVKNKSRSLFKKYNPEYVIGDRVKEELKIGNSINAKTIWFNNGKFANELPKNHDEQPTFIIESFSQILNYID